MKKLLLGTGIVVLLLLGWMLRPAIAQQAINGYRIFVNVVAPGTPAGGTTAIYVDSTTKRLSSKDDAGVVNSMLTPVNPYKHSCEIVITGTGTASALTSGDDAPANNSCFNKAGFTKTITGIYCKTDGAGTAMTVNPVFGATGSGTTILAGVLTCGASGAYSTMATGCSGGACTVSNGALLDGNGINPAMGGTLTGTNLHLLVTYTIPSP